MMRCSLGEETADVLFRFCPDSSSLDQAGGWDHVTTSHLHCPFVWIRVVTMFIFQDLHTEFIQHTFTNSKVSAMILCFYFYWLPLKLNKDWWIMDWLFLFKWMYFFGVKTTKPVLYLTLLSHFNKNSTHITSYLLLPTYPPAGSGGYWASPV